MKEGKKISVVKIMVIVAVVLLCVVIGLVACLMSGSDNEIAQESNNVSPNEIAQESDKEVVKDEKYPTNNSGRNPWAFYVEDIDWGKSLPQLRQETAIFYENETERSLQLVYKGFENFYAGETIVTHTVTPFGERALTQILIPYEEELLNKTIEYFDAETVIKDGETQYEQKLGDRVMFISIEENSISIIIANLFGLGK